MFGVNATIAAWTEASDWLATTLDYLDSNRRLVACTVARRLSGVRLHSPEATYLAWLDCTALGWGPDPAAVFREQSRVQLTPGPEFNPGGNGFARLNFATSRPLLRNLLARLCRAVPDSAGQRC